MAVTLLRQFCCATRFNVTLSLYEKAASTPYSDQILRDFGHGVELTKFRNPKLVEVEPAIAPPNTLGLRSVMFTVESVDGAVARLRAHGAELVGEVAQ